MRRVPMIAGLGLALAGAAALAAPPRPDADARAPIAAPGAAVPAGTLSVVASGGRIDVRADGVPLGVLAAAIEQKTGIKLRIGEPALAQVPVTARTVDAAFDKGIRELLAAFNYAQYPDPTTGRPVYLVTSLAADLPVREAAEVPPAALAPAATAKAAPTVPAAPRARTLDEVRAIRPAMVALSKSQAEIDQDFKRERQERVSRAVDVLRAQTSTPDLQQQAVNELVGIDDPRATTMLAEALRASALANNALASDYVARAVYNHATKLNFENAEANQLLNQLAASSNPAYRQVGETGLRAMQDNRARNGR